MNNCLVVYIERDVICNIDNETIIHRFQNRKTFFFFFEKLKIEKLVEGNRKFYVFTYFFYCCYYQYMNFFFIKLYTLYFFRTPEKNFKPTLIVTNVFLFFFFVDNLDYFTIHITLMIKQ